MSSRSTIYPRCRPAVLLAAFTFSGLAAAPSTGASQSSTQPSATFTPGGRAIFTLDLTSTPVGSFPASLSANPNAKIAVAMKDGVPMLKATAPSEFVIHLSENLPSAFTLEFEVTPKACCQPEDLSFEGTPKISRSASSMHVQWDRETIIAVGGGEYVQVPMPGDLKEILPSALTTVQASFDTVAFKLFTNGQLVLDLPNRKFVRGRVLRVFLGGQDDDKHAVYLSKLRIAAGGGNVVANNTPQAGPRSVPVVSSTQPATPPSGARADTVRSGFSVSVTAGAAGPLVSWSSLPNATAYSVSRNKIDDLACCGSSSGRTSVVSPWQDQPLPVSGTYVYTVTANTPLGQIYGQTQFGWRAPASSSTPLATPTTAVLVAPTTGTITPMPSGTPSGAVLDPATRPTQTTVMNSGPAATVFQIVNGTPTTAQFQWDLVARASSYGLRRAVAGTNTWTDVTSAPIVIPSSNITGTGATFIPDLVDTLANPTQTYTYQLRAYQPDGTYGESLVTFAPPAPTDPTGFTATATAPGEVQLAWNSAPFGPQYLIAGPGTGTGVTVAGTLCCSPLKLTHTIKQLPTGTHTWTIASSYRPGGVLTKSSSWPSATATIGADRGAYQISVESVRSNIDAVDDILNLDGVGNEIYVTAWVLTDSGGRTVRESSLRSAVHGDVGTHPPPSRVRAGSATVNGGIAAGDVISPIWAQPDAASKGYSPFVLWQGTLIDSTRVTIAPTIWESDDQEPDGKLSFIVNFMKRRGYELLDLNKRTPTGDISNVLVPESPAMNYVDNRWLGTNINGPLDRPIGVGRDWPFQFLPDDGGSVFYPVAIRVTRAVAEAALSGAYGAPGQIPIRFVDHALATKSTDTRPEFGFGDYTLVIRITRLP